MGRRTILIALLLAAGPAMPGRAGWRAELEDTAEADPSPGASPFDGAAGKPGGAGLWVLVPETGPQTPSTPLSAPPDAPAGRPVVIEKRAISFKAGDLLPEHPVPIPRRSARLEASEGMTTVGGYTAAVGGFLAFGGLPFLTLLGLGLLLMAGGRLIRPPDAA